MSIHMQTHNTHIFLNLQILLRPYKSLHCTGLSQCNLPMEAGPCEALMPSWFYNSTSGDCERFNYGGCEGNDNRFSSLRECQAVCDDDSKDHCMHILHICMYFLIYMYQDIYIHLPPFHNHSRLVCCFTAIYHTGPPNQTSFLSCPVLEDGMAGICVDSCASDNDCNSDEKCCSNGCGHICMTAVSIPFVAPRNCPEHWDEIICDYNECIDTCGESKVCCQNGCGSSVCVDGVLHPDGVAPPYPCRQTVNSMTRTGLLGVFEPQCSEADGSFKAVQCFSHYCWCVNTASGEPTSDMVESSDMERLNCSGEWNTHTHTLLLYVTLHLTPGGCVHEGHIYNNNDIVERYEGCNKRYTRF